MNAERRAELRALARRVAQIEREVSAVLAAEDAAWAGMQRADQIAESERAMGSIHLAFVELRDAGLSLTKAAA